MVNPSTVKAIQDKQKEAGNELVFSYLTLRNLIGISGMLLPVVLIIATSRAAGERMIQPSISDYYYTINGDIFVVLLSVIGVFLFTYKGYTISEQLLTMIAAIGGIGVAFFPKCPETANSNSIHSLRDQVSHVLGLELHFVFATIFFLSLALMSLIFFPRTDDKSKLRKFDGSKSKKAIRNMIYKFSGYTIILMLILLGIFFYEQPATKIPVVFILESIAVEAFGLSWITKGQTLLPDGKHYMSKAVDEIKAKLK